MWFTPLLPTLFPSLDFLEASLGPYTDETADGPVSTYDLSSNPFGGLEVLVRNEGVESHIGRLGLEPSGNLRIARDEDGHVLLDSLILDGRWFHVHVRPELGDRLDLAFFGGTTDFDWGAVDTGRAQVRAISPFNLTLLGFSDTDEDADRKLKHYVSIGTGIGGDALVRAVGPVGFHSRVVGRGKTLNRHQGGEQNSVRHEVSLAAEGGPRVLTERAAWGLSAWTEFTTQWAPRDEDGRDGVDRQQLAWGIRLVGRFHLGSVAEEAPALEG